MDVFLKSTAAVLVALIFYLVLSKHGKEISSVLTIVVCSVIAISALEFLIPVLDFLTALQELGNFDSQMLRIMLRCVGIGLVAEITSLICVDAGNAALGKTLQILATIVVVWLSLPMMTEMIELIKEILAEV